MAMERQAHPRSREVAMLMAEHARWAQREALKVRLKVLRGVKSSQNVWPEALYLASADSNKAFEAAQRANEAVMEVRSSCLALQNARRCVSPTPASLHGIPNIMCFNSFQLFSTFFSTFFGGV